ncbi:hypothetical protein LI328DRAFT_134821 [Trichoderma asperelloides]|nr:hypothetical protein LI328DRAFT_134821 [Trichoderma asperelloides]
MAGVREKLPTVLGYHNLFAMRGFGYFSIIIIVIIVLQRVVEFTTCLPCMPKKSSQLSSIEQQFPKELVTATTSF